LVLGLQQWVAGKKNDSFRDFRKALLLSPEGALPSEMESLLSWSETGENPSFLGLSEKLQAIKRSLSFSCQVDLSDHQGKLRVNGFELQKSSRLMLPVGGIYLFDLEQGPFAFKRAQMTCQKTSKSQLDFGTLQTVSKRITPEVSSRYVWWDTHQNEVGMYLYNPGKGWEKVPLAKNLLLSELRQDPKGYELPLSQLAFIQLMDSRSPLVKSASLDSDFSSLMPTQNSIEQVQHKDRPWYNDWKVWAVAGGVVAGGAIVYLLSRGSNVASQPQPINGMTFTLH
jgi:hypothetical protein